MKTGLSIIIGLLIAGQAFAAETNLLWRYATRETFREWPTNTPPYSENITVYNGTTNIVIRTNYTGTIQIGTNFYTKEDIASPAARLCRERGHRWGEAHDWRQQGNIFLTVGDSNPHLARECQVCGATQTKQPGEWK